MTLYMVGIGLWDKKDISVKGLEIIKKCDYIFLEDYTSLMGCSIKDLEDFYGKKIMAADRELVEKNPEIMLEKAKKQDVAFLVIGDVFGATTHTDLVLRAKNEKIRVECIFNASIMNAIGITGLELYKFGKTTSIPYPEKNYQPETAYDVIKQNLKIGLHTLVLLDIKSDAKKYMNVNEGLKILLDIEQKRKGNILSRQMKAIGCARIGGDSTIKYGRIADLLVFDFGQPPHCLIIPGKLHFVEEEALQQWK